jgi:hypothetical protein
LKVLCLLEENVYKSISMLSVFDDTVYIKEWVDEETFTEGTKWKKEREHEEEILFFLKLSPTQLTQQSTTCNAFWFCSSLNGNGFHGTILFLLFSSFFCTSFS